MNMIPFVINIHQSMYPYLSLKNDQVYYCPGHIDNLANSSDRLLLVSTYNVTQVSIRFFTKIFFPFSL